MGVKKKYKNRKKLQRNTTNYTKKMHEDLEGKRYQNNFQEHDFYGNRNSRPFLPCYSAAEKWTGILNPVNNRVLKTFFDIVFPLESFLRIKLLNFNEIFLLKSDRTQELQELTLILSNILLFIISNSFSSLNLAVFCLKRHGNGFNFFFCIFHFCQYGISSFACAYTKLMSIFF